MTWLEAKRLVGAKIRRVGWKDRFLHYTTKTLWRLQFINVDTEVEGIFRVVRAGDFTLQDYLALDWMVYAPNDSVPDDVPLPLGGGQPGATGATGATGADGGLGITGDPGPPGVDGEDGEDGPSGVDGLPGPPGPGVPTGGTTGQVLAKASDTDYDTVWIDLPP